ncbi:MAG: hypothetical protein M1829_002998 [Trizodia sp. TS-e1964]|nr:MAG: hypothetical protein M1829_002998 [Trizodia sp. TS-e1964]
MVLISKPFPTLSPEILTLYHGQDKHFQSPVLIFYGPSTTTNATLNGSRVQAHIFSPAGFKSYPRITVSPTSELYAAVSHLPEDQRGDQVSRGLAVSLFTYFADLPSSARRDCFRFRQDQFDCPPVVQPDNEFCCRLAGTLAGKMVQVENISEIIKRLESALQASSVSWVDMDFVLPAGIMKVNLADSSHTQEDGVYYSKNAFGSYTPLIEAFGSPAFLPTSKIRRAPSKPRSSNRITLLLREQKETIRREMCELVDTEERYVRKLHELVWDVASDFRQKAMLKGPGSSSPSERSLLKLFPESLDKILEVNNRFLDAIRDVLEKTDVMAIRNIQADDSGQQNDGIGITAFSKVLLNWFPEFAACYTEYIRESSGFNPILTGFMKDINTSFSKRVQQTGEQKLRSMIMEPVQRLPRYSLYIDNIAKLLPAKHPALRPLLKSRDIISDICSLDQPVLTEEIQSQLQLKKLVNDWPPDFHVQGRLIAAVDVAELAPPYDTSGLSVILVNGVLLLFADYVVFLKKENSSSLNAHGIMTEVDRLRNASTSDQTPLGKKWQKLSFYQWFELSRVRFNELAGCQLIGMTLCGYTRRVSKPRTGIPIYQEPGVRVLKPLGSYEGKASRWSEEVAKARIEFRFSDKERSSHKWSLRKISGSESKTEILVALFEDEEIRPSQPTKRQPALIRLTVGAARDIKETFLDSTNVVEIDASINALVSGKYRLQVGGLDGQVSVDDVEVSNVCQVFAKRLGPLIALQYGPSNDKQLSSLLSMNEKILRSLPFILEDITESNPLTSELPSDGFPKTPRNVHAGSLYNTASLRKRFGFSGLTRENSNRLDSDSKVGSVFRSLSKAARGVTTTENNYGSLSKASLSRSKSIDTDTRLSPKRPHSRDRTTVLGAFSFEEEPARPGSSHLSSALSTITGSPSVSRAGQISKKKRRSSLSDLHTPKKLSVPIAFTPTSQSRQIQNENIAIASPRTPSRIKSPNDPLNITSQIDNIEPLPTSNRNTLAEIQPNIKSDDVIITGSRTIKKRQDSLSGIPKLVTPLKTAKISPHTPRPQNESLTSTRKLEEELARKLRHALHEVSKLRKENAKLKREIMELKGQSIEH